MTSASSSSSLVGNGDDLLQAKRGESVKSWAISFKVLPICCAAWGRWRDGGNPAITSGWIGSGLYHDLNLGSLSHLFTGFIYHSIYRHRSQVMHFGKLQQVGLGLCQVCWLHSQNNWQLRGMKSKCLLEEDLSVWLGCTHPCDDFLMF